MLLLTFWIWLLQPDVWTKKHFNNRKLIVPFALLLTFFCQFYTSGKCNDVTLIKFMIEFIEAIFESLKTEISTSLEFNMCFQSGKKRKTWFIAQVSWKNAHTNCIHEYDLRSLDGDCDVSRLCHIKLTRYCPWVGVQIGHYLRFCEFGSDFIPTEWIQTLVDLCERAMCIYYWRRYGAPVSLWNIEMHTVPCTTSEKWSVCVERARARWGWASLDNDQFPDELKKGSKIKQMHNLFKTVMASVA